MYRLVSQELDDDRRVTERTISYWHSQELAQAEADRSNQNTLADQTYEERREWNRAQTRWVETKVLIEAGLRDPSQFTEPGPFVAPTEIKLTAYRSRYVVEPIDFEDAP